MEEIRELVERMLKKCKDANIPVLICYGHDKTFLAEWGTLNADTPDRIKRARTSFINAPSQTKGVMEFDA